MGIGAWLEVTDNNLTQRRVMHCGEKYLGQESFYEHFGLGEGEFEPVEEVRELLHWDGRVVAHHPERPVHELLCRRVLPALAPVHARSAPGAEQQEQEPTAPAARAGSSARLGPRAHAKTRQAGQADGA